MPTPLFPEDDAHITMKQGGVGDCYLLAALDCILCSGEEGYRLIKSLFHSISAGVVLRIKHSVLSEHLKIRNLRGKYIYFYDREHNQDVFLIDHVTLERIDRSSHGVVTNALAIKILERISAYYYKVHWENEVASVEDLGGLSRPSSVYAHDLDNRYEGSAASFVGNLVGTETYSIANIDAVVQFKVLFPDQPVFIEMKYGQLDRFGREHRYHGLRVDKLIFDKKSGYWFSLVNPWDNETVEYYSLAELKRRQSRFSIFKTHPLIFFIQRTLLDNADLLSMMLQLKGLADTLSVQEMMDYIGLFHARKDCVDAFNRLTPVDKSAWISYMKTLQLSGYSDAERVHLLSDKMDSYKSTHPDRLVMKAEEQVRVSVRSIQTFPALFIHLYSETLVNLHCRVLLSQLHFQVDHDLKLRSAVAVLGLRSARHHPLVMEALAQKSEELRVIAQEKCKVIKLSEAKITDCIKQMEAFKVTFDEVFTEAELEKKRQALHSRLQDVLDSYSFSESIRELGYHDIHQGPIGKTFHAMTKCIDAQAKEAKNRIDAQIRSIAFLEKTRFSAYLSQTYEKTEALKTLAGVERKYLPMLAAASQLCLSLDKAKKTYLTSQKSNDAKITEFKLKCHRALRDASSVLAKELDWRSLLDRMAQIVARISIPNLRTMQRGFFPPESKARIHEDVRPLYGTGLLPDVKALKPVCS